MTEEQMTAEALVGKLRDLAAENQRLRDLLNKARRPDGEAVEGVVRWLFETPERTELANAEISKVKG